MRTLHARRRGRGVRWSSGTPSRRPLLLAGLLGVLLAGCRLAGPAESPTPPELAVTGPAIADGPSEPGTNLEVARLLAEGRELLDQGRAGEARDRARQIELQFPTVEGSAMALLLGARASMALEDWPSADQSLARFLSVLPSGDPLVGQGLLLQAEARWEDDPARALDALFLIPTDSDDPVLDGAEARAAEWAVSLETSALRDIADQAPRHPRLLPVFTLELAVRRHLAGAEETQRHRDTETPIGQT